MHAGQPASQLRPSTSFRASRTSRSDCSKIRWARPTPPGRASNRKSVGSRAPVVSAIKKAAAENGRTIDEDHYGAGFAYRFGSWDEPVVEQAAAQLSRLGPGIDARGYLAVGGAGDVVSRAREYVEAGISKFVLRPIASGDAEVIAQTRRLIDEVVPAVHS